jgi:hypothetical protein
MLTRLASSVLAALALVVMFGTAAPAQIRFDVGPLVAFYAPLSAFQPAPYYSISLPNSPGELGGVAWGGQGRVWFTQRFGVQLQVASARSTVAGGNTPEHFVASTPASVLTASLQALYNPASTPRKARLWLNAGVGLVRHGGTAYAPYGAPVQFATAFGFGSAIPLSSSGLQANLGVTTLLYSIDVSDNTGTSLEHGFQVDPLIHAGLSWGWP